MANDANYLNGIIEKDIEIYNDKKLDGMRGLLLLPKNIDSSFLDNPTSGFLNNGFLLYMSCLNFNSKTYHYQSPQVSLYSHMVDTNGISIEDKSILSQQDLILIMYSSLVIAKAEVCCDLIFEPLNLIIKFS